MRATRRDEWFDDDAFWRELYPWMFTDRRFAEALEQVDRLLALTRPAGNEALDLCCGPGRWAVALARQGYAVTGVDRTQYLLDRARLRARRAGVKVRWVRQDMREFLRPEAFDLAISMFTSLGYFARASDDVRVLANLHASLRPGGICLVDLMGKEILARIYQPTISERLPDGSTLVQRHRVVDGWTRVHNEWTLLRRGRAKTFTFAMTIYSGQELRERMERAGFGDVKLYGNLEGAEYGPEAQRLIAVGRRG